LDVFQEDKSWLKDVAFINMRCILSTLDVSQEEMSWLKDMTPSNASVERYDGTTKCRDNISIIVIPPRDVLVDLFPNISKM
jgi:hypothetical protein